MNENDFIDGVTNQLNRNPYSAHIIELGMIGQNKKVLDIGCGKGFLSQKVRQLGNHVTGIELMEKAGKIALKNNRIDKLIVGNIEEITIKQKYDIILLTDVLEHLVDPLNTLLKLKHNLKDSESYIIVCVPNISYWAYRLLFLAGKFDYKPNGGTMDSTHLRFFTYKSIKQLIIDSGFDIVDFDTASPLPFMNESHIQLLSYKFAKLYKSLFAYQFIFKIKKVQYDK